MLPVLLRSFIIKQTDQRDIPYVDLRAQWQLERKDLLPIIESVFESGSFINGEHVLKLEHTIAEYCSAEHCVTLNSGTDALMMGLLALGIKPGDEVITPPNSFIASTAAIVHVGAIPVFVDVLEDQLMNPDKIERLITPKTKAIMPVHLTGKMVNMSAVSNIADAYKLKIIEDSAQSIGSKFKNISSGMHGDIGCFSTHPLKNLNASGDGGFIITNDEELATTILRYRNHGFVDRNRSERFGLVSRMDEIQAAILNYRLKKLNNVIGKRRNNAQIYQELLNTDHIFFPRESECEFNSYHTFVIQSDHRDLLAQFLKQNGIHTAIHYPCPIHLQPAASDLQYSKGDFPIVEAQAERILSLPIHEHLTISNIKKITNLVNSFFEKV